VNEALSAKVISWASQNIGPFNQYHSFAEHKQRPQFPDPPMVDPPCHVCGDTTQTPVEAQVAAWVSQSEEPENTYVEGLLAMSKYIQQAGGANSPLLSPAAQTALSHFDDDADFMRDARAIVSELVNQKAIPIAQAYHRESKQAYAGISFLMAVSKDEHLLGGDQDNSEAKQVMQWAEQWEESVENKIDNEVLGEHKYNLCLVYGEIARMLEMLGGQPPRDMVKYTQMLKKMQDLVKFDVNLNLNVAISGNDGSHTNAAWAGKANLTLNLDLANSCYTPVFGNGGQMAVNVTNWDMVSIHIKPDGTQDKFPVQLTSPHAYNAALAAPQLNLCDPQPIFQIPLGHMAFPQEQVTAQGHTTPTSLFGAFLSAVVATNEINSKETNAVTGQTPSLPGGPSASNSSPSGSGSSAMQQDQQALNAHKGDASWLMSEEGQAVIADMQKQALKTAQSKMAGAGIVVPNATSFGQLALSLDSARLPWTNGQAQPVNKTLHMKKDTTDITLTVTVSQASQ
jgi:hypothetical protein